MVQITNGAKSMTNKTEIKKSQSNKILTSLDPQSENFNFELWAREVGQQMKAALYNHLSSSHTEASEL